MQSYKRFNKNSKSNRFRNTNRNYNRNNNNKRNNRIPKTNKKFKNFNPNRNNYRNQNRNRFNNNNNNFQNTIRRQLNNITKSIKQNSLGGGPLTNINSANKSKNNNPSVNKKEIRYDVLYDAFEMYKMGKYYSIYKTPNLILRLPIYFTISFSTLANTTGRIMWMPYAYPYINKESMRMGPDSDIVPDMYSNFMLLGTNSTGMKPVTTTDIGGTYRLLCASMKITNITTNTNKGGAYTIYRTTRNSGQPIIYKSGRNYPTDQPPYTVNNNLLNQNYDQEPIKYLFNANETSQVDEYNTMQGNTIFQEDNEFMGMRTDPVTAINFIPVGGDSYQFNPEGVNVKYIVYIDPIATVQTYKVQTVAIFEVTPRPSTSLSALAYKVDKTVNSDILKLMKDNFPIHSVKA